VPLRLKFWSSLGPTGTEVVELEVGAGDGVGVGAVWASAVTGAPAKAAAMKTAPARKIAFIRSRSSVIAAHSPPRAMAIARRVPKIQALGG